MKSFCTKETLAPNYLVNRADQKIDRPLGKRHTNREIVVERRGWSQTQTLYSPFHGRRNAELNCNGNSELWGYFSELFKIEENFSVSHGTKSNGDFD